MSDLYRILPAVDLLIQRAVPMEPRGVGLAAARWALDEARGAIRAGATVLPDVDRLTRERARLLRSGRMVRVINATGVVVHTNLGRSSWSPAARDAALQAMGYCNVEMELPSGKRGGRQDGVRAQLQALCGCESAILVNNCAAAVLLALTAIARDREVIVSRGQLVEIGGSFRIPDVIASGGARLVDVGTTNRTRSADYEAAITDATGALLTVHPSNFRQIGFTESADRGELVSIAQRAGIPLLEDLGSGAMDDLHGEAGVRTAIQAGVDLVLFSGDKLLGGPQAGVIVGKKVWVDQLRRHPLYMALRVGKVTLAAMEGTLAGHLSGELPPTPACLGEDLGERTERFARELHARGLVAEACASEGRAGGGALPERVLPSVAVRLAGWGESETFRLRTGTPSVVTRLWREAVWIDLRGVAPAEEAELVERLVACAPRAGVVKPPR